MKKMNIISVICLCLFIDSAFAQSKKCNLPILIDEYGIYKNFTKLNVKIKEDITEDSYMEVVLYDCMGAMQLKGYKNNLVVVEGNYINSLDTLKACLKVLDPIELKESIIIQKYFQPLKNGTWKYYDLQGKLIKQEEWQNGILQNKD